jgi:hypothetical protein
MDFNFKSINKQDHLFWNAMPYSKAVGSCEMLVPTYQTISHGQRLHTCLCETLQSQNTLLEVHSALTAT